jgi:hypothetical protein
MHSLLLERRGMGEVEISIIIETCPSLDMSFSYASGIYGCADLRTPSSATISPYLLWLMG